MTRFFAHSAYELGLYFDLLVPENNFRSLVRDPHT